MATPAFKAASAAAAAAAKTTARGSLRLARPPKPTAPAPPRRQPFSSTRARRRPMEPDDARSSIPDAGQMIRSLLLIGAPVGFGVVGLMWYFSPSIIHTKAGKRMRDSLLEGRLEHERRQGYTGHDETDAERKAEDKYRVAHQKQEKKGKGKGEGEEKE